MTLRPGGTRACVHHDGALGDVLLSVPCIKAIGKQSAIDLICRAVVGRLLAASGLVQASYPAGSGRFASWYTERPDEGTLGLLDRCGRAFVFTLRDDAGLAATVSSRVPDTGVVITIPPEGDRTHAAEFRLRQLPAALRTGAQAGLDIPDHLREQARELLARPGNDGRNRPVVIHPGSGGSRKCWPLERYFTLAERLSAAGHAVLFLGGPAEQPELRAQIEAFVRRHAGMAPVFDADLGIVAGLAAESGLYIGNDSGITHLAAAAGAPVIALFGPTDPAVWAPQGPNVRVIAAGTLDAISVDAVFEASWSELHHG
ncbi:MAG: glycosyltransferase family 9 protein [Nitrospirota bacterium]